MTGPDAVLIAACLAYPGALAAYAAEMVDDGPANLAHTVLCDAIDDNPPQTMAGLIAKARAGASEDGDGGYGERWLNEVGRDLLRLAEAAT